METTNTHLSVANPEHINVSVKYCLIAVTVRWYQIVRSTVYLQFPTRTKSPLAMPQFPA